LRASPTGKLETQKAKLNYLVGGAVGAPAFEV